MVNNSDNCSMISVAYDIMQKEKKISFDILWKKVTEKLSFSEEKAREQVSCFYTQLTLDGRFVFVGNNKWCLRDQLTCDQIVANIGNVFDDENENNKEEEINEEAEDEGITNTEEQGDQLMDNQIENENINNFEDKGIEE